MSAPPPVDVASPAPAGQASADTSPGKTPQFNVYMVMLGLSLLFIILACLFLASELNTYEFKLKP